MGIKPNQLSPDPLPQSAYSSAPATGAGKGAWGVKVISGIAEGFYIDSNGNEVQLTSAGSPVGGGGGGEVNLGANLGSSGAGKAEVFANKTGVTLNFKRLVAGTNITLSQDGNEITINSSGGGGGEANTASNLGSGAQLFKSKVSLDLQFRSIIASAPLAAAQNADDVTISADIASQAEAEAGVASNKLMTPERTAQAIAALAAGGSSSEFSFILAAGADIATRIAGATGVPDGWVLAPGDTAGVAQLGTDAETLVITHNESKIALMSILELNAAGPAATQGYTQLDLTTQGVTKSTTDLNSSGIIGLQPLTNAARALVVFVKLI